MSTRSRELSVSEDRPTVVESINRAVTFVALTMACAGCSGNSAADVSSTLADTSAAAEGSANGGGIDVDSDQDRRVLDDSRATLTSPSPVYPNSSLRFSLECDPSPGTDPEPKAAIEIAGGGDVVIEGLRSMVRSVDSDGAPTEVEVFLDAVVPPGVATVLIGCYFGSNELSRLAVTVSDYPDLGWDDVVPDDLAVGFDSDGRLMAQGRCGTAASLAIAIGTLDLIDPSELVYSSYLANAAYGSFVATEVIEVPAADMPTPVGVDQTSRPGQAAIAQCVPVGSEFEVRRATPRPVALFD